ncbi:MAG: peptidylprolyl isomerase [Fimbriimonadales bacterium]
MLIALLAATVLTPQVPVYKPNGPIVQVVMAGRGRFEITTDPTCSPKTVAHILALVKKRFYDRQRIHRVEPWVTQWGASASKTKPLTTEEVLGGGSGKDIPVFEMCEVDFTRGVVGIASTGLQMPGDSQIFILKKDTLRLYHSYAVFGKVTKGMEVVDRIAKGDRIKAMRIIKPKSR